MGKRLIQQRRGKGGSVFRFPSFRSKGSSKMISEVEEAEVLDIVNSPNHTAPLAKVRYDTSETGFLIAPEGIKVKDKLSFREKDEMRRGDVHRLKNIPEGTEIFNIESVPGDGGKFARSSGVSAKVFSKTDDGVVVQFSSKKKKLLDSNCRAMLGRAAGGGRKEKPFLKAGKKYKAMRSKHKYWPKVSGASMNAVAHPFGTKRSSRKSKARPAPKNAPPGRKVGMLSPKNTGRKEGRETEDDEE